MCGDRAGGYHQREGNFCGSLLMASLQATLRSQAAIDTICGTAELVARLNRHLFRNTSDDRYASFFYAVCDADARTLTYTNAGHLDRFVKVTLN